jgi:hypothetical protein
VTVPTNSATPTGGSSLAPTAPAYNPIPGTIGLPAPYTPYTGPGEVITGYGGGGGLQVPIPTGAASPQSPPTVPFIPGTTNGVPGVPNSPVTGTTAYSTPTPKAAMPGDTSFSLQSIPTWGWIAIAIGAFLLLKD